jgi:hypothetical protein
VKSLAGESLSMRLDLAKIAPEVEVVDVAVGTDIKARDELIWRPPFRR